MIENYFSEKIVIVPIYYKVNIHQKPLKQLPNLMKYSITYYIRIHCPISILYEKFYSCDFTKKKKDFLFKQM